MGYKTQTIHVNNQSTIDVTMSEDNTSLEEVVVVGYGVQKRRDIVGAVETLSTKGLEERMGSSMSISRSLQGAIPGLTMTFSDGKPNRGATVRIRGAENSIGSGGSALVMVDGVETDMSTVNPDDIESITVLKDASSTAVYGARGTFGVILLTTKKPQKGSAKVTYNGTFTFYKRATKPQMVTNGYDYTTSFLESYVNAFGKDPSNINNVFKFSRTWYDELARRNNDPSYEKWRVNNRNAYEYFGNTNWYDVFYKDYTTGHQHNISVTGGGDVASYYVSGRMFEQDGIYNAGDEKYQQFNVKAKGIVNVKPWLRVENTTDFMYRYSHQPTGHTGISTTPMTVSRMLNHQAYPVALVTNPDGTWTEAAVYTGWAGFVEGNSWRKDRKFDMNNRTAVTIDLLKDVLVAAADVSFYFNQTDRRQAVNQLHLLHRARQLGRTSLGLALRRTLLQPSEGRFERHADLHAPPGRQPLAEHHGRLEHRRLHLQEQPDEPRRHHHPRQAQLQPAGRRSDDPEGQRQLRLGTGRRILPRKLLVQRKIPARSQRPLRR